MFYVFMQLWGKEGCHAGCPAFANRGDRPLPAKRGLAPTYKQIPL